MLKSCMVSREQDCVYSEALVGTGEYNSEDGKGSTYVESKDDRQTNRAEDLIEKA